MSMLSLANFCVPPPLVIFCDIFDPQVPNEYSELTGNNANLAHLSWGWT